MSDLEQMLEDVPRIINLRFSFIRAQMDAFDARLGTVEAKVDRLQTSVVALEAKVDALPRVLAEMLDEREKRGR